MKFIGGFHWEISYVFPFVVLQFLVVPSFGSSWFELWQLVSRAIHPQPNSHHPPLIWISVAVQVQIPVIPTLICQVGTPASSLAHSIKSTGLHIMSLCKIPHVALDSDRTVVTTDLDIKLGLQIECLCKIPQFVLQTGGGWPSEVKRGGLVEPYLGMRKKATDGATTNGSTELKIEALRARLDKMEALIQDQSKELKAEVISSQQFMKLKLKDQLDEFFARLMKVQTSTPPPQPLAIGFMASNVAQVEQSSTLGDHLSNHSYV
jgi:hypothetical protein